jgi:hypothetical protein
MSKYKRKAGTISSKVQEEIVMVNVNLGNYYSLNEVASRIWELLETEKSIDEICTFLQEEYEIDLENCREDVSQFIEHLVKLDVIETV